MDNELQAWNRNAQNVEGQKALHRVFVTTCPMPNHGKNVTLLKTCLNL